MHLAEHNKNADNIAHTCIMLLYLLEEADPPCVTGDVRVLEFGRNTEGSERQPLTQRASEFTITAMGIVQLCYDGLWGSVCDGFGSGWDEFGASVACRQLLGEGKWASALFPLTANPSFFIAILSHWSGAQSSVSYSSLRLAPLEPTVLSFLQCRGNESSLLECDRSSFGNYACLSEYRAAVTCTCKRARVYGTCMPYTAALSNYDVMIG